MVKVYVTKHALTWGIQVHDVPFTEGRVLCIEPEGRGLTAYYHKPDWTDDEIEALARADDMRKRKIKSLEKQLKKLQAMERFGLP